MTTLDLAALRKIANNSHDGWEEFCHAMRPSVVISILDRLEAAERDKAELERGLCSVVLKLSEAHGELEKLIPEPKEGKNKLRIKLIQMYDNETRISEFDYCAPEDAANG